MPILQMYLLRMVKRMRTILTKKITVSLFLLSEDETMDKEFRFQNCIRRTQKMNEGISISKGLLWVLVWFGFMLLYTALDVGVWRKIALSYEKYLNLFSTILCMIVFLVLLTKGNQFTVHLFRNVSFQGILLAAGGAVLLYFVLDKGLDPMFERLFPVSEESYQQTLQSLSRAPVISFIQVCILAPIIEEILMRGFLLDGLSMKYGQVIGLFVSAALFALLHFNMVQTLSAFICGIVLGLLYLHTGSLLCCILTHMGYNVISYLTMILPLYLHLGSSK